MFHRNSGRFRHKITLLRPSAPVRDELGGISTTTYEAALTLFAMVEQKSQTRQQFIGDYVTSDTRYFVVRDIRSLCPGFYLSQIYACISCCRCKHFSEQIIRCYHFVYIL